MKMPSNEDVESPFEEARAVDPGSGSFRPVETDSEGSENIDDFEMDEGNLCQVKATQ